MAWWALYKWFKPWRKTPYTNYIRWYSNYLYEEWFNSLTPEQQELVKERIQKEKDRKEKEFRLLLNSWSNIYNHLLEKADSYYMKEKW